MKTSTKIFAFFFATALMIACAAGESEILKQARSIQEGILKQKHELDSTIDLKVESLNKKITEISMDSAAMADSTKRAEFTSMQTQVNTISEYKSKLNDWVAATKMLPSMEEVKKGAENPFGKDAKDQDILTAIKKSQEEFGNLKSEVETIMQ